MRSKIFVQQKKLKAIICPETDMEQQTAHSRKNNQN